MEISQKFKISVWAGGRNGPTPFFVFRHTHWKICYDETFRTFSISTSLKIFSTFFVGISYISLMSIKYFCFKNLISLLAEIVLWLSQDESSALRYVRTCICTANLPAALLPQMLREVPSDRVSPHWPTQGRWGAGLRVWANTSYSCTLFHTSGTVNIQIRSFSLDSVCLFT